MPAFRQFWLVKTQVLLAETQSVPIAFYYWIFGALLRLSSRRNEHTHPAKRLTDVSLFLLNSQIWLLGAFSSSCSFMAEQKYSTDLLNKLVAEVILVEPKTKKALSIVMERAFLG
ncbi:hypothetical protein [Hymenobacter elongatus]|uniref:hypothetical protein n=1 Tax=Hymenobacter elongatus TaxID=877208 RepID=UPI001436B048|nr:hypothetical protein [Hymenobacter elongatus]